ncbi:MAG: MBL fold metallo-hydrolase, partial [Anaerotignaceae bacterium]
MKVKYLNHSGFSVELEKSILVFDYYTQNGKHDYIEESDKEIIFFVSHFHQDHFDKAILKWEGKASFVVDEGVDNIKGEVLRVVPNKTYEFRGFKIETLKSNDEGVAFLVEGEGKVIFHAGDLNWWHWNGESESFNKDIEKSFKDEINKLKGRKIDVAFLAADHRLEDKYYLCVDYFIKEIGAVKIFPMHFWRRYEMCDKLIEKIGSDAIMKITNENQEFYI